MIEYNGPKLLDQAKMSELSEKFNDETYHWDIPMVNTTEKYIGEMLVRITLLSINEGIDMELAFIRYVEGRLG